MDKLFLLILHLYSFVFCNFLGRFVNVAFNIRETNLNLWNILKLWMEVSK